MSEPSEPAMRPMTSSDLDEVLTIERASFPVPWKREHFLHEIDSDLASPLVAVWEGMIIGYVCVMSLFEEAQILNIAVAPEYRGRGVGRMLLERAIIVARDKGAEALILEVRVSNLAAIGLYDRYGFERYSVRKRYYEGKEDAVLMKKALTCPDKA